MDAFDFLNVDLDIESRYRLQPLLDELSKRLIVLHSESSHYKHFAVLESCRTMKTPDGTIKSLCDALESLSPNSRSIWKKARHKVFNIGVDVVPGARMMEMALSAESIRRIAQLGATIVFTCYQLARTE